MDKKFNPSDTMQKQIDYIINELQQTKRMMK